LSIYKSWINALEKKQTSYPEAYKEFYNLWVKMYEKAFDTFFEDMPTVGGLLEEIMEPVMITNKMYTDYWGLKEP
jgi:hypothetical protein